MGVITGIGDKSLNKNVIVPKIDADINDYILNKNCIINGLEVIGNTLTAGMCVLKGYRGILENDETLNGETYIYGKFTLNFDNGITEDLEVDNFDILKTNSEPQDGTINPASINQAGIYYLLLYTYTNGAYVLNSELNTPTYPAHAYEADETDLVKSGAVIKSGVTTPTPLDTNAHLTEPLRVANTEYVHNQIEEEIALATDSGTIYDVYNQVVGTYTVKRKAKLCVLEITFSGGSYYINKFLSSEFYPKKTIYFMIVYGNGSAAVMYSIDTNGNITRIGGSGASDTTTEGKTISIGYETN